MARSRKNLQVHNKDSREDLVEKNEKLQNTIRRLEKENRKLRSENKTLSVAWNKTEKKYKEAVRDIPLQEIFEHLESDVPKRKLRRSCPSCGEKTMKKISFEHFHILICGNCDHRAKIDETDAS
jgi:type IV secretory pathway VirB4 component